MMNFALVISIVYVYTLVFGVIGVFTILKTPKNLNVRRAMIVLNIPAIFIAAQFAFNWSVPSALPIRIVFGGVTAACVGAIVALIKKPAN